jgi:uncharacterized DUF497 family protein
MRFTWDPDKERRNWEKHGISFGTAIRVFETGVLEEIDDRFDYEEERVRAFGIVDNRVIVVIYTERENDEIRIISARRATPKEERRYYAEFGF